MSIIQQLAGLGIATPKPILAADEVRSAVNAFGVYVADNTEVASLCARLSSRSIKPDDVAAEMMSVGAIASARQGLKPFNPDIARAVDRADRVALHESADELYTALKPIVAEQGRIFAEAVAVVGPEPDGKLIARMGPSSGAAWATFTAALAALREVESIVNEIATAGGAIRRLPVITWVDADAIKTPADLERLASTYGKFPQLAENGYTIALNTPAVTSAAMARIEGINAAGRAAEVARKQSEVDANRADFDRRLAGNAR